MTSFGLPSLFSVDPNLNVHYVLDAHHMKAMLYLGNYYFPPPP